MEKVKLHRGRRLDESRARDGQRYPVAIDVKHDDRVSIVRNGRRCRYANVDTVAVDDAEFLGGKEGRETQEDRAHDGRSS
jgi:chromosomal replication initiation ATPase DnaA